MTAGVVLAGVAVPIAAGALAALPTAIRRTGIEQWLHRGAADAMWAALLSGPAVFIVFVLTIPRSAVVAEAADPRTISIAYQQGATSVLAWVASDDLGCAIILLTVASVLIMITFLIMHGCFLPDRPGMPAGPPPVGGQPEAEA